MKENQDTRTSANEMSAEPGRAAYTPSPKVLELLKEIFTPEIENVSSNAWGVDLHRLVDTVRTYGILEALAYSRWTPPVKCRPPFSREPMYMSLRIWHYKDGKGHVRVGYENPVPVRTMKIVRDGRETLAYDKNELYIKPDSYSCVLYAGKPLDRTQVEQLIVTGTLASPMVRPQKDGSEVREVVQCHPYNKERLISIPCDVLFQRLSRAESRAFKAGNGEQFTLTDDQALELSVGHTVKLGYDHFARYDIVEGKVKEVADPEIMRQRIMESREAYQIARAREMEARQKAVTQEMSMNSQG